MTRINQIYPRNLLIVHYETRKQMCFFVIKIFQTSAKIFYIYIKSDDYIPDWKKALELEQSKLVNSFQILFNRNSEQCPNVKVVIIAKLSLSTGQIIANERGTIKISLFRESIFSPQIRYVGCAEIVRRWKLRIFPRWCAHNEYVLF